MTGTAAFQHSAVGGVVPGLGPASAARLARLCSDAVARLQLDLTGSRILTEAASGPFASTALIAALAGAEAVCVTRSSRWGTAAEITAALGSLASSLGIRDRIHIHEGCASQVADGCDIVTNLGFVRPIDADIIKLLAPGAVVALMWEPWEFRPGEIDLDALAQHEVALIGTNESHPNIATLDYLGPAAGRLLLEVGVEIAHSRIAIIGSAPFGPALTRWLTDAGAILVDWSHDVDGDIDAIVIVEHRDPTPVFDENDEARLVKLARAGSTVAHICGTIDRQALRRIGFPVVPPQDAPFGVMTVSTAYAGPRAVVDLHAGGLRAAADVWHARRAGYDISRAEQVAVDNGFGLLLRRDLVETGA